MEGIEPGALIDGRYEVVSELGEGGMGVVYQARQPSMNRVVAIKFLKSTLLSDREKVDRFIREAQLVSRLHHENIVNVYSVGTTPNGMPYIAMEFLEGQRLSDLIEQRQFLPVADALPLFIQVCDALSHAHEMQIVHRDIKPSNIMLTHHDNGGLVVKVVDFGIAKSVTDGMPALTQTGLLMGSAFYMSPGQCAGRVSDVRSDVYSLGCTLFETLTGRPPFVGESFYDTLSKQLAEAPPAVNDVNPAARISGELQAVIDCMLEKEPANRYQSMELLKSDLERILAGERPVAMPVAQAATSPYLIKKQNNRRMLVAVSVAVASALSVVAAWPLLDSVTRTRVAPDVAGAVHSLYGKAVTAEQAGDYDTALKLLGEALEGARSLDDDHRASVIVHRMGWLTYKRWSKQPGHKASDKSLADAARLIEIATSDLERKIERPSATTAAESRMALRHDVTLLLICYWDLFRVDEALGDQQKQLQHTDKFVELLAKNLRYSTADKPARTMLDFAVTESIKAGNEARARYFIDKLIKVLPAMQMENSEIDELCAKYAQQMTAKFSPASGSWCKAQFAARPAPSP